MQLKGLEAIKAKMKFLGEDGGRYAAGVALRKAAKVIAQQAAENAKALDDSGTGRSIESNMTVRLSGKYQKATGNPKARIGIAGGARPPKKGTKVDKSPKAATPYWRFFEFGTSKMAARPFFRRSVDQAGAESVDRFTLEMSKGIDLALRRRARAIIERG